MRLSCALLCALVLRVVAGLYQCLLDHKTEPSLTTLEKTTNAAAAAAAAPLKENTCKPHAADPDWLHKLLKKPCQKLGTSQGNQDCMLNAIFDKLGTTNKYYVEYGFNTDKQCEFTGPNTCNLWKQGWNGLLLDGSHENPDINLHPHFLYRDNIAGLLRDYQVPVDLDFLSSDVDSHDFFLLESILQDYRPRVISTEYNPNYPTEMEFSMIDPTLVSEELRTKALEDPPQKSRDPTRPGWACTYGASASAFRLLMEKHGYVLIGISQPTELDLFWARRELVECYNLPSYEEIMRKANLGSVFHRPMIDLEFLDWVADVRVWEETKDIELARAAAKKTLATAAKFGRLGACFAEVKDLLQSIS